MCNSITLIGMAGAGKTSVGKVLSSRLDKRFIDSDDEIERELSMSLDDFTVDLMTKAIEETVIGKSFIIKLKGVDPDCHTSLARKHLREKKFSGNNKIREQLLSKLTRKEKILDQLRNDLKMRSLLQIWLYIHVPFTFAALAALIIHIFSVFYYW